MGDDGNILDHVLGHGHHLAGVRVEGDVGLGEGLKDVVTGLGGGNSVVGPAVPHPVTPLSAPEQLAIKTLRNVSTKLRS